MKKAIAYMALAATMASCGSGRGTSPDPSQGGENQVDSIVNNSLPLGEGQGEAFPLGEGQGEVSIHTMGKVVAERYADLAFETALPIEQVLVKNGQHVHRGQVLAQLDTYKLRNAITQQQQAIAQAELQIEQARLQMQDVIIAQGYDPDKTSQIPADVMHNADVKSGYALSKNQLAIAKTHLAAAQHELQSGVLTAPFDGVVANVAIQAHQLAQAGQPVCRVIASGDMAVEFRVMEADLSRYQIGTAVSVVPVANASQRYEAKVSEINPVVDAQGAVTLRARISNASNLFDGMNVMIMLNS